MLNAKRNYAFPQLQRIRASGVTLVRNQLIQHPEKPNHSQNFTQGFVLTNHGPVLRTASMVVSFGTGQTRPTDDSLDKGLFVNATQLRDELQAKINAAIEALSAPDSSTL